MVREIGRWTSDESPLAVARGRQVVHARRMSATPVRQQSYPHGVALFGVLLAVGLVLVSLWLAVVWVAVARDERSATLAAALGALLGVSGATAMAGTCLSYQVRPKPQPPVGPSLVWRPTPAVRAEMVLTLAGLTMVAVSAATVGESLIVFATIVLLLLGIRIPLARLEADRWGSGVRTPGRRSVSRGAR
jgi:hypothetical protein